MIKKFFEKDSVLKIVSFLIAILVWLYVIYIEDPKVTFTVDDIPVNYKTAELPDDLALVSYDVKEIDVKISANRSDVINLEDNEFEAFLDLSSISEAGQYNDVKINVLTTNKDFEIIDRSEKICNVKIDDIISKKLSVGVELKGDIPEGYTITSDPVVFINYTTISGPKTYIEAVKQAFIQIDCSKLTESKTVSSNILLLDNENALIDENHQAYKNIKLSEQQSSAYISVGKTKNVPVEISDKDNERQYSLNPSTVEIYTKNKNITKIYTESITDKKADKNGNIKLKLIIPDDVTLITDNKDVTVNIKNK